MKKLAVVKYLICIIYLLLTLTACSTGYQSGGLSGGYSDTQLDNDMFLVSFSGNAYTDNQKAVDFCLLRCSELCLSKGFKYFVIIENKERSEKSSVTSSPDLVVNETVVGNVARRHITDHAGSTYTFSKPSVSNTILCFKGKPKETSYYAQIVMKSVKEKYKIE